MGATLTGTRISDTYDSLLKATDNGIITSSAKQITDGVGTNTPLYISTSRIGIGVSPTTTFQVAGNSKIGGDLTVTGNLLVEGTTTTVDTDTLSVKDPLIIVGNDNNTSDLVDLGFYGLYDTSGSQDLYAGLYRSASDTKFHLFKDLQEEPTTTVNTSGTGYTKADLVIGALEATTGTFSGNISSTGSSISLSNATNPTITVTDTTNSHYLTLQALDGASKIDFLSSLIFEYGAGNTEILRLSSTGVDITGTLDVDDVISVEGSGFGRIEVGGASGGYIDLKAPNSDDYDFRLITSTGGAELYSIDTLKFYTGSGTDLAITIDASQDVTLEEDLILKDGKKIKLGDSQDLEIYYDGTTNRAYFDAASANQSIFIGGTQSIIRVGGTQNALLATENGNVSLYYSGATKLNTTSTGVDITGDLLATGTLEVTSTGQSSFAGQVTIPATPSASTDAASKGYVDSLVEGQDTLAEILANGNTTGGTNISVSAGDDITFADNSIAFFGAGNDFYQYHDGTNSYIKNYTGDLTIAQNSNDKDIIFQSDDGAGGIATYYYLDGSLGLNRFLKDTLHNDDVVAKFGTGSDLRIQHSSGNNSSYIQNYTGDLSIENLADDKDIIFKSDDGSGGLATYFKLDGSGVLNEFAQHTRVIDNKYLGAGSSLDMYMLHDGTNSFIRNGTGNLTIEQQVDDGDVIFKSDDGSGGTATYFALDGGITRTVVYKNFNFQDDVKLEMGTGADLQIYHDGTDSFIKELGTGSLKIWCKDFEVYNAGGTETLINADVNAGVQLYFDNSQKFATTSTGVTVTGGVNASSTSTFLGNGAAAIKFGNTSTLVTMSYSGTTGVIRAESGSALQFDTNGVNTALTIDTSQNVGIGTTSPSYKLSVVNSGNVASFGDGTRAFRVYTDSGEVSLLADGSVPMKFYTSGLERMRINTSGNVGIGTSSPTDKLDVAGAIRLTSNISFSSSLAGRIYKSSQHGLAFQGVAGSANNFALFTPAGQLKIVNPVGTDDVSINPESGNVGIGTTSPDRTLHVKASAIVSTKLEGTNAGHLLDLVNSNASPTYNGLRFTQGTTNKMAITHIADGTTKGYVQIGNSWGTGSEILVVDGRTSNVGIGTTLPDAKLSLYHATDDVSINVNTGTGGSYPKKTGISFGATSTSLGGDSEFKGGAGIQAINTASSNNPTDLAFWTTSGGSPTERMRIDNSGNVGIGTTSPDVRLEVVEASPTDGIIADFVNSTNAGGTTAAIKLSNADSEACDVVLGANRVGANFGSDFFISLSDSTDGTNQERFRITEAGNVGIGTTSPSVELEIASAAPQIRLTDTDGGYCEVANVSGHLLLQADKGNTQASSYMRFDVDGSERMRIHSDGNIVLGANGNQYGLVTIRQSGTSNDSGLAVVNSTNTKSARLWTDGTNSYLSSGATGTGVLVLNEGGGNVGIGENNPQELLHLTATTPVFRLQGGSHSYQQYVSGTSFYIRDVTNTSNRIVLDSSGNVGIGTTSPVSTHRVTIEADSSNGTSQLYLKRDSTDQGLYIDAGAGSAIYNSHEGTNTIYGRHIWQSTKGTDTVERMRIESSGFVGIGTTAPAYRLDVGDVGSAIRITGSGTGYTQGGVIISSGTSDLPELRGQGIFLFNEGKDVNWYMGTRYGNADEFIISRKTGTSIDTSVATSSNAIVTINNSENVGIGTTSPDSKLDVTGGDITVNTTGTGFMNFKYSGSQMGTIGTDGLDLKITANADLQLLPTGNVGIGTTSPSELLTLNAVSGAALQWQYNSGNYLRIEADSGGGSYYAAAGFYHRFFTSGSERMRIQSNGNVAIGNTNSDYGLLVEGTFAASNTGSCPDGCIYAFTTASSQVNINVDTAIGPLTPQSRLHIGQTATIGTNFTTAVNNSQLFVHKVGTNSDSNVIFAGGNTASTGGTGALSFGQNGQGYSHWVFYHKPISTNQSSVGSISTTSSATSYNTSSDYRLKENVIEMTGALDRVSQLKPSRFNFIEDANKTVDGFLAHEVQDIVPEAITGEKDAVDEEGNAIYQGIDQAKLVPLLVGAIQELKAEIEQLKTQINN